MVPVRPPYLLEGDAISLAAPAGIVNPAELRFGVDWLSDRYKIQYDTEIVSDAGYLAGDDERRLGELQSALDAPSSRAVLAARGGFGTSRLLDRLVLDDIAKNPKWVVGSSDLTALLLHLWDRLRLITLHGPMAATLHRTADADRTALIDRLEGRKDRTEVPLEPLFPGDAQGPLIGGNLTMLAHMMGTVRLDCFDGAILFVEDVGEKPYRLDRYLTQLLRAGVLRRVAGVVLGELTGCGDDAISALVPTLGDLHQPVARGYPAAHGHRNLPFYHGAPATLRVSKDNDALLSYI